MNTKIILSALIGVIIGAGGTVLLMHTKHEWKKGGEHESMSHGTKSMHGAMDDMMKSLEGKTGDEFDKAFLAEMVVHHEGAVMMAEAALTDAMHPELKAMAEAIITAQNAEIAQMKKWQESWYGPY